MPRLYGNRIMLREYQTEDYACMREWVNEPEIVDCLSDVFLYPQTAHDTRKFLDAVIERENEDHRGFVIADLETSVYMGQIDLFSFDWRSRVAEMGMVIGNPALHGLGFGSEAIRLLQQFAFNQLNLNRLELKVHADNAKAIRCYINCGFQEEGRLRDRHFANGKYNDLILMSILKREYDAREGSSV
ncbi:RimJ/RimL family protein N-acetyltransferase [Paenibacillus phyllosphaerae]|uniref:RimJ/RimL family protein N-acetyltransferase n=1 Tax=Paenibacillus phyllosphaerae TaxID=274593 RepID=A0A7W5B659_9BACL|nr:GNAT family protein [Paenibacillus phyllosphaerae]MBB3114381.1 RimJ/RimL family protein N-acetyltransferase [Paenibacillus phyllosphaerae]